MLLLFNADGADEFSLAQLRTPEDYAFCHWSRIKEARASQGCRTEGNAQGSSELSQDNSELCRGADEWLFEEQVP